MVKVGDLAPDFELVDTQRKPIRLSSLRGKKVVLAFYPGAFTRVCQKELCTFRDMMANFNELDAEVLGISVDSPFANAAFAAANNLQFPLLSDYTRSVAKMYGGVHEDFLGLKGFAVAKRAVYVIDKGGKVQYAWVSEDPGQEPPYAEIQAVLSRI